MAVLVAFALCGAGFAGLALSMTKHHRDVFGIPGSRHRRLAVRALGWGLLGLSLLSCHAIWGAAIGIVVWFGLMTVTALLVAIGLTHGPRSGGNALTGRKRGA